MVIYSLLRVLGVTFFNSAAQTATSSVAFGREFGSLYKRKHSAKCAEYHCATANLEATRLKYHQRVH